MFLSTKTLAGGPTPAPEPDILIVGGGLAGLTTAVLLARQGRRVTVLERSQRLGGRAQTTVREGVHFNLGPHAIYVDGDARRLLTKLGLSLHGRVPRFPRNLGVRGEEVDDLPGSPSTVLRTKLIGARDKIRLSGQFRRLMSAEPAELDHMSLRDMLDELGGAPRLLDIWFALARVFTYANDPDQSSAGLFVRQAQMGLANNVIYLDGGWQTLVEGLRRLAAEAGVDLRPGHPVTAVDPHGGLAHLSDGSAIQAAAFVLAVDPQTAAGLLPASTTLAGAAALAQPVRAAALDLALRRLPRPENAFGLGLDRPTYFSVHTTAARLAPEGVHVVHALKYLPPGPHDPPSDRLELETLIERLQPGWRDEVLQERFLPNLTVANALPLAAEGGQPGRPDVCLPEYENVFVAGDWVGRTGWLVDAVVGSAHEVAGRLADTRLKRPAAQAVTHFK